MNHLSLHNMFSLLLTTNLTISGQPFPGKKNHKALSPVGNKASILGQKENSSLRASMGASSDCPDQAQGFTKERDASAFPQSHTHPPGQPPCPCAAPNFQRLSTSKCLRDGYPEKVQY